MFSTELEKKAKDGFSNPSSIEEVRKVMTEMLNMTLIHLKETFESVDDGRMSDEKIIATYRRVNNTWERLHDKLASERMNFFQRTFFKDYCESKKDLQPIAKYLNNN